MLKKITRLLKNGKGPTAFEYVLLVAGVAVIIIAVVWFLTGSAASDFDQVGKSGSAM